MRVRVDHRFLDEARRYALRFTCDACAHHAVHRDTCAHGWPDQDHRHLPVIDDRPTPNPDERHEADLTFCKEFELA